MKHFINHKNIATKIGAILKSAGAIHHDPTDQHALRNDLGLDSLDQVEAVVMIEKFYGIEIPEEIVENIVTVGDLVEAVSVELNRNGPPINF